ncbi:Cupin 2 conserved barrel domain protein [Catenulispora acidiphila DSM 44928]|uniref:Cupin 2 conserved barrel domain protein n=1 Tax=Catenulispora acidiphila (strain DSM 44928 / JCM 14897 / NBRC 102108 / NRRL B-24433 / ID139908) TaxID=479433 RepID=C7QC71_CATAD|nr:cupin domain-containing protein [Catenulispora acidiphila]ACU74519.1 Cupin 2 conserved barrel domain protein [Catenulispora acidiphila DSM 44928]
MSYPSPRYLADQGEVSATFRTADADPELNIGTASRVSLLSTGGTTGGLYGLYRWDMLPGTPTPPKTAASGGGHYHRTFSEAFFILNGTVALYDGQTWRESTAGDYLFVPPGGIHSFANTSGEAASMLVLFAPGAPREPYFEELAAIRGEGRELSPQEWTELYARHDQFMA